MEKSTAEETNSKKRMSKKIIIPIILVIVILLTTTGIFIYSKVVNKSITEIFSKFESEEKEYTVTLDEFLVNLNSDYGDSKEYLRINMALMYTDEKQTEKIQSNISLIRDLIISSLRDVTIENALEEETMINVKLKIMESINHNLGQDLIKEVYITDIIVK
ncbi:MAG: flagellar basal body-associated FliL family protein [Gudongella sp.]|nr:flagellar basal body-associated FliL family protein [Gudongella sp.]